MKKENLAGKLNQVKGVIMELWGELTGDEKEFVAGRREQVIAALMEKRGLSHEEAEAEFEEFIRRTSGS